MVSSAGSLRLADLIALDVSFMPGGHSAEAYEKRQTGQYFPVLSSGAMFVKSILAIAAAVATGVSPPSGGSVPERGLLLFRCSGTMRTADAPPIPIVAEAFVDLGKRRVFGFGIRSARVVVANDRLITFGGDGEAGHDQVEGSLDRRTGKARVVVLAANDPARELIAMELDCRQAPGGAACCRPATMPRPARAGGEMPPLPVRAPLPTMSAARSR